MFRWSCKTGPKNFHLLIMQKKITFFIFDDRGTILKRLTADKAFLSFLSLCAVVCLAFFVFFIYDYNELRKELVDKCNLEAEISSQLDEIADQRKQIQSFANEINGLKAELVVLSDFEKKIRILADIDKTDGRSNIFGVGGSMPENLDPNIQLAKSHNGLSREMHDRLAQLSLASIKQKEDFEALYEELEEKRNLLAATPSIRPAKGWISSKFGYRKSPFTGQRELHKGLDIAAWKGTPIVATAGGIVIRVGSKGSLGKLIVIDHGYGIMTRYAHIQKALKKRGDTVKRGETVALIGNTGRSTGSHLHYEVLLNGVQVNPEKYILN